MEELGYEDADIIDPKTAIAFEFCDDGDGTIVTPVERSDEGFVVQSLNDTLLALATETYKIRLSAGA